MCISWKKLFSTTLRNKTIIPALVISNSAGSELYRIFFHHRLKIHGGCMWFVSHFLPSTVIFLSQLLETIENYSISYKTNSNISQLLNLARNFHVFKPSLFLCVRNFFSYFLRLLYPSSFPTWNVYLWHSIFYFSHFPSHPHSNFYQLFFLNFIPSHPISTSSRAHILPLSPHFLRFPSCLPSQSNFLAVILAYGNWENFMLWLIAVFWCWEMERRPNAEKRND